MAGNGNRTTVPSAHAAPAPVGAARSFASFREIFGIDLRTLALFRVLLGVYLITDLLLRARDLTAHYTDFGIMPRDVAVSFLSPSSFSIHLANGSAAFQAGLFGLAGLFAVMLILGWRTRLATVVSWVLLLSLQNRNTMILSGEDNLAILLLFWAMFLPLGARFSVDAALDSAERPAPNAFWSVATTALLIQGMSMYFFSALLKSDPIWIPDGTAVYYALNLNYFATSFALWFREFETLLSGLTYYVWALELIGPILIFTPLLHRPVRAVLMCCFITMHIGFWLCLEIGLFPLISIVMNLTFMPGWMWDGLARRLRPAGSRELKIWYDRDCTFCWKMCRIITTFLCLRDIPIRPAQDDARIGPLLERENSWVVTDGDTDHLGWLALRRLVAGSPLFKWVARPMGWRPFAAAGDGAYAMVAANRPRLARLSEVIWPMRPLRVVPGRLSSLIAALALVFVTVQNVSTLPAASVRLSDEFRAVRQALGLYQFWTMFAPHPEITSPWPLIEGRLTNGMVVDVYNRRLGAAPDGPPDVISADYENGRWRKFLSQMEDQSYENIPQRLAYNFSEYLCRSWNTGTPNHSQLSTFEIVFYVEWTNPPGVAKDLNINTVWSHDCFG